MHYWVTLSLMTRTTDVPSYTMALSPSGDQALAELLPRDGANKAMASPTGPSAYFKDTRLINQWLHCPRFSVAEGLDLMDNARLARAILLPALIPLPLNAYMGRAGFLPKVQAFAREWDEREAPDHESARERVAR